MKAVFVFSGGVRRKSKGERERERERERKCGRQRGGGLVRPELNGMCTLVESKVSRSDWICRYMYICSYLHVIGWP